MVKLWREIDDALPSPLEGELLDERDARRITYPFVPGRRRVGRWLEAHGETAPGIWMKLSKSSAPARTISKTDAIDVALCHGWIDGQLDRYDEHYWLVRFTPRKARSRALV